MYLKYDIKVPNTESSSRNLATRVMTVQRDTLELVYGIVLGTLRACYLERVGTRVWPVALYFNTYFKYVLGTLMRTSSMYSLLQCVLRVLSIFGQPSSLSLYRIMFSEAHVLEHLACSNDHSQFAFSLGNLFIVCELCRFWRIRKDDRRLIQKCSS